MARPDAWYSYFCAATLRFEDRKRASSLCVRLCSSAACLCLARRPHSAIGLSTKAATSCRYARKMLCSLPVKYVWTWPGSSAFSDTYVCREYSFRGRTSSQATPMRMHSAERNGGMRRMRGSRRRARRVAGAWSDGDRPRSPRTAHLQTPCPAIQSTVSEHRPSWRRRRAKRAASSHVERAWLLLGSCLARLGPPPVPTPFRSAPSRSAPLRPTPDSAPVSQSWLCSAMRVVVVATLPSFARPSGA